MTIYDNSGKYRKPYRRPRPQPAVTAAVPTGIRICPVCQGSKHLGYNYRPCPACKGKGIVPKFD